MCCGCLFELLDGVPALQVLLMARTRSKSNRDRVGERAFFDYFQLAALTVAFNTGTHCALLLDACGCASLARPHSPSRFPGSLFQFNFSMVNLQFASLPLSRCTLDYSPLGRAISGYYLPGMVALELLVVHAMTILWSHLHGSRVVLRREWRLLSACMSRVVFVCYTACEWVRALHTCHCC
jgi:hypothetical protein